MFGCEDPVRLDRSALGAASISSGRGRAATHGGGRSVPGGRRRVAGPIRSAQTLDGPGTSNPGQMLEPPCPTAAPILVSRGSPPPSVGGPRGGGPGKKTPKKKKSLPKTSERQKKSPRPRPSAEPLRRAVLPGSEAGGHRAPRVGARTRNFKTSWRPFWGYAQLMRGPARSADPRLCRAMSGSAGNTGRRENTGSGRFLAFSRGGGRTVSANVPAAPAWCGDYGGQCWRATLPATVDFSWQGAGPWGSWSARNPDAAEPGADEPLRQRRRRSGRRPGTGPHHLRDGGAGSRGRPPMARMRHGTAVRRCAIATTADGRSIEIGRSGRGETLLRVGRKVFVRYSSS